MTSFSRNLKRGAGQAIIELALITPLCVLLLLGTIDLLRACYQQQVLNQAARAAVRCAMVEPHLSESNVPQEVILAEAVRVLETGKIDPAETAIDIKVPGFNYLVGEGDLTTDPIIVTIQHDFESFLTQLLNINQEDEGSPRTLVTLEGVAAGYYEDIGTVIDMDTLEGAYPEVFEPVTDPDPGEVEPPPPPPPDRDGDGVRDAWDSFPDNAGEQYDSDRDGIGNNADLDDDNDGLADANDPSRYNPDIDGDGIRDGNDNDMDGDGIPNANDPNPGSYNAPTAEG
jgi:hypothetical protein